MSEAMKDNQHRSKEPMLSKMSIRSKASKKLSAAESSVEREDYFHIKNQQLFLVEFLIDTVNLDPAGFCDELMEGQTCVTLKFLNFLPMIVCERDFDENKRPGIDKIHFNSGKSLMFALTEKQCEHRPPMMTELIVSKKCSNGSPNETVDMGRIKVCMVQLFQEVYNIAKFSPDKLPASRSIKDCFMLTGTGKRIIGEIGVYIRLTCLGRNVVTEFQCGTDLKQDPILFKNLEGKQTYQFTGMEERGEYNINETIACRKDFDFIGPTPKSNQRGGQGDVGHRLLSSDRRDRTYAIGNPVILDTPEKVNVEEGVRNTNNAMHKVEDYQLVNRGGGDKKASIAALQMKNQDQNVFVLRAGDKGEILDRGKMILEFRTPKQKILPKILPPYHEDIAVQTDSPKKVSAKGKEKKK